MVARWIEETQTRSPPMIVLLAACALPVLVAAYAVLRLRAHREAAPNDLVRAGSPAEDSDPQAAASRAIGKTSWMGSGTGWV
jgi:hypothetical protein